MHENLDLDPSTKNWLVVFLDEVRECIAADTAKVSSYLKTRGKLLNFSHFYIHESGLFYGYVDSHKLGTYTNSETWNGVDRFKIAVVEGLVLTYLHSQKRRISQGESYGALVQECAEKLYEFYVLFTMNDVQSQRYRTIFQKNSDKFVALEQAIDARVSNPSMLERGFWKGSQFNIFTALDVVYFAYWLQGIYEYDRRNIIKNEIIALMDEASHLVQESNKNALSTVAYFIASGNFGVNSNEVVRNDIDFGECLRREAPLTHRLQFEYAAYVSLVDDQKERTKTDFLHTVAKRLGLSEQEEQESLLMVDSFLANNAEHIFYLHYGEGVNLIKNAFNMRFQSFVTKNKAKIVEEVMDSKELVELLRKSVSEELSDDEKQKVKMQIFDLMKTVPSLAIFMIPGGTIILPVLFKILPEEILMPSSFINKKTEK